METRTESLIPVIAYDDDHHQFYCRDHTLAFGWKCQGLSGGDERIDQRLRALLGDAWPDGTCLQFILVSNPNLFHEFEAIRALGRSSTSVLREAMETRARHLSGAVDNSFVGQNGLQLRRFELFVVVKIPAQTQPVTLQEMADVGKLRYRTQTALTSVGLMPQPLNARGFLAMMCPLVNRSRSASWRVLGGDPPNEEFQLNQQVFDASTDVRVDREGLWLDDVRVQMMSPKVYPQNLYFGLPLYYVGDPLNGGRGLRGAFMVTLNVFFPPSDKARGSAGRKRDYLQSQARGGLANWLPRIHQRAADMEVLLTSVDEGNRLVKAALFLTLFSSADPGVSGFEARCADASRRADVDMATAVNFWAESGFTLLTDRFIALPAFVNALPFGAERAAVRDLGRYRTVTTEHVSRLAPIFADWTGTGTSTLNFVSRSGALMSVCPFDSPTNYNFAIAAQSGSGKSFLANEMIVSVLAQAGLAWVIDQGRSYQNICEVLEGTFVDVGATEELSFNPFPLVQSYEDEVDVLEQTVAAMASPTEVLTDLQRSVLSKTMRGLFADKGRDMTVTDIARMLGEDEDERVRDVGTRLYQYTEDGQYGRYFHGPNTVGFNGTFTVLELEGLRNRKHLQRIVLLMLIYAIQQSMYHSSASQKKLVIVDEAWELITDGEVGGFMEAAYRRFRKHGGSAGTITQSLADFHQTRVGKVILTNASTTFLLGQNPEVIENLRSSGHLTLNAGAADRLKTVHTVPGLYSEIYVRTELGEGVGRLTVSGFQQLLYSTRPADKAAIKRHRDEGLGIVEAINAVLAERARSAQSAA